MAEYGYQSELCIPILGGERVIGLIDVFDTRPRDYAEYLDFLRSVGQTAAGAIENALLLDKLGRRNAALAELVELGRTASNAGGLSELVRAVGPRVVDLMEADGCQVFILRGGTLVLRPDDDDGQFLDDCADRPLDLDLFPSTRVAIAERTALVVESPDDPRLSDYERELYRESGTQSEICVPLVLEDRVVGLLDVYDHQRRDYAEHRDFLLRVAQIMAARSRTGSSWSTGRSNQTLALPVEAASSSGRRWAGNDVVESVARRLCAATSDAELRHLHAARRRRPPRGLHRRRRSGRDHVGRSTRFDQLGLVRVALEFPAARAQREHRRRRTCQRVGAPGGPQLGRPGVLCCPHQRGEVIGVAGMNDDDATRFDATTSSTISRRWPPAPLPTRRCSKSSSEAPSVWRSWATWDWPSSCPLHSSSRRCSSPPPDASARSRAPRCATSTPCATAPGGGVTEDIDEGEVDAAWQGRQDLLDDWTAMRRAVERAGQSWSRSRNDPQPLAGGDRADGGVRREQRADGAADPRRPSIACSSSRTASSAHVLRRGDGDDRLDLPVRRAGRFDNASSTRASRTCPQ